MHCINVCEWVNGKNCTVKCFDWSSRLEKLYIIQTIYTHTHTHRHTHMSNVDRSFFVYLKHYKVLLFSCLIGTNSFPNSRTCEILITNYTALFSLVKPGKIPQHLRLLPILLLCQWRYCCRKKTTNPSSHTFTVNCGAGGLSRKESNGNNNWWWQEHSLERLMLHCAQNYQLRSIPFSALHT